MLQSLVLAVHYTTFAMASPSVRLLPNALTGGGHDGARPFNLSHSPRRTHHYKEQIGIQEKVYHKDLTEVSQKGAFLSHIPHKFMLSQDACQRGEEHTKRKSRWLSVSVTAERCQPGRVSSGARRQRKKPTSYPLAGAPHWLNSPVFCSSSSQRGVCLHFGDLSFGSGETQKTHLLLNHP